MDGTNVLSAQPLQVGSNVHAPLYDRLELIKNADSIALYLTQQFQIVLRVEWRINAHALATSLGSLADDVQTAHHLTAFLAVGCPVIAAAAERQKRHCDAAHAVHRVVTVVQERHIVVALGQILCIETAHGYGTDAHSQGVGHM